MAEEDGDGRLGGLVVADILPWATPSVMLLDSALAALETLPLDKVPLLTHSSSPSYSHRPPLRPEPRLTSGWAPTRPCCPWNAPLCFRT